MNSSIDLIDVLLRGGAATLLCFVSVVLFRSGRGVSVERLGALFLIGSAAYALASSPHSMAALPGVHVPLVALATFNSVFFWWFATALFDDAFEWRVWRLAPLVPLLVLFIMRRFAPHVLPATLDTVLQQLVVVPMLLHALWIALAHRKDDLIERRRAFRLTFVCVIGLIGLVIAAGEIVFAASPVPGPVLVLHAATLIAATAGFALWILPQVTLLAPQTQPSALLPEDVPDADAAELARIQKLMIDGAFREQDLTIASLAKRAGLPEYRLRRLINGVLGHKNFTAFLNTYRLEAARAALSDPERAREQITAIAFDLGYGSIGPFNRAFKAETGQTPSEFRRAALSKRGITPAEDEPNPEISR